MKDGAFLVNVSRGEIVLLDDLLEAIDSGKLSAAGLDVVEGDPIRDPNHPVNLRENITLTPHAAYSSVESIIQQHSDVAETVLTVFHGTLPKNTVNKQLLRKER